MSTGKGIAQFERLAALAAMRPMHMPEMLAHFSRLFGAEMSTFELYDASSGRLLNIVTDRPDIMSETASAFERHYVKVNPRLRPVLGSLPGAIVCDDCLGTDAQLMRHEFYADFLARSDMRYFGASRIVDSPTLLGLVSAQISPRRGRLGDEQKNLWRVLLPHLVNAVAINVRFLGHPVERDLAEVVDHIAAPLAVLGLDGRLHFANRAMEQLLSRGNLVTADNGWLRAVGNAAQQSLSTVMRRMQMGARTASAVMDSGTRETICWRAVCLLQSQVGDFDCRQEGSICLVIDSPVLLDALRIDELKELLGLTRREAEVGLLLAEGLEINAIASRLELSRNTVRSHAAALREKLGVSTSIAVAAIVRQSRRQVL